MQNPKAHARPLTAPEVVLNLWAYVGDGGYIMRLAGRAYVMDGDDGEKLKLLRLLSSTDFLSAEWQPVPANFKLTNNDGQEMKGVAQASMLAEPHGRSALFGPLMEAISTKLPEQVRSFDGDYTPFRLELPEEPLMVATVVMEYEDGRLEAMVADR